MYRIKVTKFKKCSTRLKEFVSDGRISGFVFHRGLKSDPLQDFELFLLSINTVVAKVETFTSLGSSHQYLGRIRVRGRSLQQHFRVEAQVYHWNTIGIINCTLLFESILFKIFVSFPFSFYYLKRHVYYILLYVVYCIS